MAEDLVGELVGAMVSGAGQSLAAGGSAVVRQLVAGLRERLRGHPAARGRLEIALDAPADPAAGEELASALREICGQDPGFAEWLGAQWAAVGRDLHADQSRTVNLIRGNVTGPVVQARDVQGGIRIGGPDEPGGRPPG
jgi:hypothetical protein